MNKFLLGTSALVTAAVLTAPAFAAEKLQLELRGYHVGGISVTDVDGGQYWDAYGYGGALVDGDDTNSINFGSDSEVHFSGSTTLDNGLEVSFRAELELEDDEDAHDNFDGDLIDEVYIQFSGGAGRLQFGQNDGAMYQQHIAAPNAFVGHGVNQPDVRMDPFGPFTTGVAPINTYGSLSGDDIKITYFTPAMGGLQLGASYTPNPCKNDTGYSDCVYTEYSSDFMEISGTWTYDVGGAQLGISGGYGTGQGVGDGDPMEWSVGGEIGFGGLTIGGSYREVELSDTWDETHWDLGASYEAGPWAFSITHGDMERIGSSAGVPTLTSHDQDSWIGGVTYMYGPGMQMGFGIQTMDSIGGTLLIDFAEEHEVDGTSFFIENVISF